MKRFKNISRTLGLIALVTIACIALASCTSIRKYEVFHPCEDANCPKCTGEKRYICPTCKGRGWLPPTFVGSVGVSSYRRRDHSHVSHGLGMGIQFSDCPRCGRDGMVRCGTTTYYWKCKTCGTEYDHAIKTCPACGAK